MNKQVRGMTSCYQPLTGSNKVEKLSMWHTMIVDWRLLNPGESWAKCAEYFKVTQAWLSSVINSDLFKVYFAERMAEHQEYVSKELVNKAGQTAMQGFDLMQQKMKEQASTLSLSDVREATDMAMKSLGFGVKQPAGGVNVEMNFGAIDSNALESARNAMRSVAKKNTEVGEAEVLEEDLDVELLEQLAGEIPEIPDMEELQKEREEEAKRASLDEMEIVLQEEKSQNAEEEVDILREVFNDPD